MLKAAVERGWLDEKKVALETLTCARPSPSPGWPWCPTAVQAGGPRWRPAGIARPLGGGSSARAQPPPRALPCRRCFRRAGADIILTYYAKQASKWLIEDGLL